MGHMFRELIAEALYPYGKGSLLHQGWSYPHGTNNGLSTRIPNICGKRWKEALERLENGSDRFVQLHRIDPNVPFEKTRSFCRKHRKKG